MEDSSQGPVCAKGKGVIERTWITSTRAQRHDISCLAIVILIISGTQLVLLTMVVDILRKLETNQQGHVSTIMNLTAEIRRLENLVERQRGDLP